MPKGRTSHLGCRLVDIGGRPSDAKCDGDFLLQTDGDPSRPSIHAGRPKDRIARARARLGAPSICSYALDPLSIVLRTPMGDEESASIGVCHRGLIQRFQLQEPML